MVALDVFRVAFLLISITCMSGLGSMVSADDSSDENENEDEFIENCEKQTSFFLTEQQSLQLDFYYDAGGLEPDTTYIKSMCEARELFKHVTISFSVGIAVKRGENGNLECDNTDKSNKDCTYSFLDACASQLVPDYTEYVCCVYTVNDATTVEECVQKQTDKLDEFESCVNLQHPTIKPDEILLENSKNAWATFPQETCWPFLGFNGQTEKCAEYTFYNDPVKIICAMLAEGVEEECNE